jgi:hypothetical protein
MNRVDLINNVLKVCKLDDGKQTEITNTDTSIELNIDFDRTIPVPSLVKSELRETGYSDFLVDSDNNSILFNFNNQFLNNQVTNCVIKLTYIDKDTYKVNFQVINYIGYKDNGEEYSYL